MKSLSDLIHRTPWLVLLGGGFVALLALAFFVTPYHIIELKEDTKSAAERQAVRREIDNAFADNALDVARGVLKGMIKSTSDPARREELEQALESLDEARQEIRAAGVEVLRAKRDAAQDARQALKDATAAIQQAQKDAERALNAAGANNETVRKALEDSLAAARKAQEEAQAAADEAAEKANTDVEAGAVVREGKGNRRIVIRNGKPSVDIQIDNPPPPPPVPGAEAVPPTPPLVLPAERKAEIRRNVTHDLYRIVAGAGLLVLFIPLFVVAIVAKFFIDRSRAAMRMAELKRKEAEYHRMSQQVTEAKLSALQAQVEPHFLYNTLASVQALTEVDPPQATAMTGHLIQYLRNALPKMRESVSTVGQEIELVRAYLNILQMRMGKRLTFTIDVPPELAEAPFPPLMLPSLVENAIKHGLEPQREGGEVRIRAEEVDGRIRMIVADTGRGFSEAPGAGVGLANIRERLAALYGDEARLTLEANEPRGVVATLEVPRKATGRKPSPEPAPMPPAEPQSTGPRTRTQRFLGGLAVVERVWRRGLWYAFLVLVGVAAILAVIAAIAAATGHLHIGTDELPFGPGGAMLGGLGIVVGFFAVILALAIVMVVLYGLGFVLAGVAVIVVLALIVGLSPILAPLILLGLGIWWWIRRQDRKGELANAAPQPPAP
jgi:hypothetical protein